MKQFECALKHNNLERDGIYNIDEVLPFVVSDKRAEGSKRVYNGHEVKMWSLRYQTFKKSLTCVGCGITGKYFALERIKDDVSPRFHFNLYAVTEDGTEVLITKDHIQPKSKGGKDHVSNVQTMCKVCNEIKMDKEEVK